MAVLKKIKELLKKRDYIPVLFDFDRPESRDLTETISTLAHLSRFVIVDVTAAKFVRQELQAVVPSLPSVPVQPLMAKGHDERLVLEHLRRYPWVLDVVEYVPGQIAPAVRSAIAACENWLNGQGRAR